MPMEGDVEKKSKDIQAALEKVECVHLDVDKLEQQVSELHLSVKNGEQTDAKRFEVMGELLMVQLLKLDGIEVEGEARAQRKAEVKRVQGLVDNVDNLKLENGRAIVPVANTGAATTQEQNWVSFPNGSASQPQPTAPLYQQSKQQQQQQWAQTNPNPQASTFHRQSQSASSPNPNFQNPTPTRTATRTAAPGPANSSTPPTSRQQEPQVPYGFSGRPMGGPNVQISQPSRQSPSSTRRGTSTANNVVLEDDDFDPRGEGQNGGGSSGQIVTPPGSNLHSKSGTDRSGGTFAPSPLGSHSRQSSRSSSGMLPLPSERMRSRDPSPGRREGTERRGFSGASPGRSRSVDPHDSSKWQQGSGRQHYGDEEGRRSSSRPSSRGGEEGRSSRRQTAESRQQLEVREEETGGRGSHMAWNISQRDYSQRRDNTPQREPTPQRDHTPQRDRERERESQRNNTSQREYGQSRELTPQRSERASREFMSPGQSRGEREYSRRAGGSEGQRPPARNTSPLPRGSNDRTYMAERQGSYSGYVERDVNRSGGRDEREVYGNPRGEEWDVNKGGARDDREHYVSGRGDYGGGRDQYGRSDRDAYGYGGGDTHRVEREPYRGGRYDERDSSRGGGRERDRWEGAGYGASTNGGYGTAPLRGTMRDYGTSPLQPPPESMDQYQRGSGRQAPNRSLVGLPPPANGDTGDANWETFDVGATYPLPNAPRMERNWTKF